MKTTLSLLFVAALTAASLHASTPKVEAVIAKDKDSKPATAFVADVPKLYAFFRSTGTKTGESLRAVWIADDVGTAAPNDTKIDEATLTADQDNFFGAFSLSKPTKGWPTGKYRVEIYSGVDLAATVKFTIDAAGETSEKDAAADDEADDEMDDDK